MSIQVGKVYLTRGNYRAEITDQSKNNASYLFSGSLHYDGRELQGVRWTKRGRCNYLHQEDAYDIIEGKSKGPEVCPSTGLA